MIESGSTMSDCPAVAKHAPSQVRRTKGQWFSLAAYWFLLCVVFVYAAIVQAKNLNLSAAAGGQMPYLDYAKNIAEGGMPVWYGDHNRLPLVPTLLAFVYTDDWPTFVTRSIGFSITLSTIVLLGVSALAFRLLPSLSAAAFSAIFAFTVLLSRASFVQAELLYYGLSFLSWLLMCRLLQKPTGWLAGVAGLTLGLTYLTKASAWPMMLTFLLTMIVSQLWLWLGRRQCENSIRDKQVSRSWGCAGIFIAVFFLTVSPYVWHNYQQFGRVFYNVNSTFFMWCDSWPEAKAFADAYPIGDSFPDASEEVIPSFDQYWRSHTASQMITRLRYGLATLFQLAIHGVYFKYLAISLGFCGLMTWRLRRGFIPAIKSHALALLFSATCFMGYLLAYAWYVPVAYGDRFVLSLYTPLLFAILWWPVILSNHQMANRSRFHPRLWINSFSAIMLGLLVLDGVFSIRKSLIEPTPNFVRFYYNESRELLYAGNRDEAVQGFLGVAKLDPNFAPARVDLGMMALTAGHSQRATRWLGEAVTIDPNSADAWNSFGSAWSAAGDFHQGIDAFQHAVELNPAFAIAWYNLGGAYSQVGSWGEAKAVHAKLMTLDRNLAKQLSQLLPAESEATFEP